MSTILSLLALLGGATAVIAIGTRMSLYFYRRDVLEVHPLMARRVQVSPSEAQLPLEHSAPWYLADSISASTRYARIGLGVIACIVLLAILVIAGLLSGMVL
jgi:hypothetical protein